jgi:hypothetical protein
MQKAIPASINSLEGMGKSGIHFPSKGTFVAATDL